LARFINHCCDPNCSAQVNSILDKKHIILYAKRAIKPNEEITYDYNFECEEEKIQCRCGAKNCLGRLN
jgi:SET domain-containing protein